MAVMATARTRSLVEQASAELLGPGAAAAPLTLKGSDALVFYRRDEQELKRRHAVDAHRLDRIAALTTLLQLPVDEPVPLALLKADLAAGVRRLPYGAAELQGGHVRRRAVRPLTVDLVVVRCPPAGWRDGLVRAGRSAPFARRALLADPPAAERDDLLMQAAFYGIGVLAPTRSGAELILEPRAYRPSRHTPAAWCFVEELHQRLHPATVHA